MYSAIVSDLKSSFRRTHDDDIVDRYNHKYTVMTLAIFIFIISSKQYFGEPIVCWTPAQFTGSHTSYANTICWTHGTYPVGSEQPYHTVDRTRVLPYYQWVPFILLFMACCFYLPKFLWHTLSRQSGIDIASLAKNAIAVDDMDIEKREATVDQIARHIHLGLTLKYEYEPMFKRFNLRKRIHIGKRYGNYLYLIYMFIKLVYILNLFGQLILLNSFFGFQYYAYGFEFLRKFLIGDDYSRIDLAFPRVTFCDFKIRNLGDNIHQHSVQCALPINLFNEKFFIFLWFWLMALAFITTYNFLKWILIAPEARRISIVSKYLMTQNKLGSSEKDRIMLRSFVNEYCHLDGAFIFALIRRNTNFITVSEIICSLWLKYCREYNRSTELKSTKRGSIEFSKKTDDEVEMEKPLYGHGIV